MFLTKLFATIAASHVPVPTSSESGRVQEQNAQASRHPIEVYGKAATPSSSAWRPLELSDERGVFVVHPRPPKKLLLEPWEKSHCLMIASSTLGAALVARGLLLVQGAQVPMVAAAQMSIGSALLAAAAVYFSMLPERKEGPSHDETDPRLLPRLDYHCAWMDTTPVPLEMLAPHHQHPGSVRRGILQAWFGDPAGLAGRDQPWRAYAQSLSYTYTLITQENVWQLIESGEIDLSNNNRRILSYEMEHDNWWGASDIVRYGWLLRHGGIYVDVDMNPPKREGNFVDLQDIVSPRGLTLITEEFGRDFGARNGAFIFNGFLSAPANDPTLRHLCDILPRNWAATNSRPRSAYTHGGLRDAFACFSTGPFLLNRVLNGAYQIVPFRLAAELGIVDGRINQRSYGLRIWTENRS